MKPQRVRFHSPPTRPGDAPQASPPVAAAAAAAVTRAATGDALALATAPSAVAPLPCHARARQRVQRALSRITRRPTLAPLLSSGIKLGLAISAQGYSADLRDIAAAAAAASLAQAAAGTLVPRTAGPAAADRTRLAALSHRLAALEALEAPPTAPPRPRDGPSRPALQALRDRLLRQHQVHQELRMVLAGLLAGSVLLFDSALDTVAASETQAGRLSLGHYQALLALMAASIALDLVAGFSQLRAPPPHTQEEPPPQAPAVPPAEGPVRSTEQAPTLEDFLVTPEVDGYETPEEAVAQRVQPLPARLAGKEHKHQGSGR